MKFPNSGSIFSVNYECKVINLLNILTKKEYFQYDEGMNMQTLKTFIAITRYGKLTEAARNLNITQSALSRTVRQLEEEIGAPLFDHSGNRIRLNRNGAKFLTMAEDILNRFDGCIKEIREDSGLFDRSITITISSAGISIPHLIHGFRKLHPETWFSLHPADDERPDRDAQFTFFCTTERISMPDVIFLAEEPLYLTVSLTSPLAKLESVALSELSSRHFLFADNKNDMAGIQMHYCRMAGFEPEMDNIIDKQIIMLMLLELDEGITLLPKMDNPKLAQIPISDIRCTRMIYMRKNQQVYSTRLAREFEKYCISYFRQ